MGFRKAEIAYSLSDTNVSAPRLKWSSEPLQVGEGRWMGEVDGHTVVEQLEAPDSEIVCKAEVIGMSYQDDIAYTKIYF